MVRNDIREKQPPKNTDICEQQKLPDSIYFGGRGNNKWLRIQKQTVAHLDAKIYCAFRFST
jgi:hypothetical protein